MWGISLLPHLSLCENFSQIGKEMAKLQFYHKLPQILPKITTPTANTTPTIPVTHTTPTTWWKFQPNWWRNGWVIVLPQITTNYHTYHKYCTYHTYHNWHTYHTYHTLKISAKLVMKWLSYSFTTNLPQITTLTTNTAPTTPTISETHTTSFTLWKFQPN